MANQGVDSTVVMDQKFPISVDKKSIAGDMIQIAKQDGASITQNTSSSDGYHCVNKFKHIVGWMDADQDGSLTIVQSDDGYTDRYTTTIATTSGNDEAFDVEIVLPFVKVIWTEGNTGAATLNLFAYAKMV